MRCTDGGAPWCVLEGLAARVSLLTTTAASGTRVLMYLVCCRPGRRLRQLRGQPAVCGRACSVAAVALPPLRPAQVRLPSRWVAIENLCGDDGWPVQHPIAPTHLMTHSCLQPLVGRVCETRCSSWAAQLCFSLRMDAEAGRSQWHVRQQDLRRWPMSSEANASHVHCTHRSKMGGHTV